MRTVCRGVDSIRRQGEWDEPVNNEQRTVNSGRWSVDSNQQSAISDQPSAIRCPFCGSSDTEMLALFGQQLMTTQHYCHNCKSAFEAVKWEESKAKGKSEKLEAGDA